MLRILWIVDISQFIEKVVRGALSYIAQRYSKTNNKQIECYSSKNHLTVYFRKQLMFFYELAMSEFLLEGKFKLIDVGGFDLDQLS